MKLSIDLKKYPCYNTSLKDLKGEQWKEIPYAEGYYLISNYGRLKMLSRPIESNGSVRYTKDKMRKLNIQKVKNEYINELRYMVLGSFVFNKQQFHFSIRRLVYEIFIQPVTKEKMKDMLVYCKDGNGLNNHVSNLGLFTKSEMERRIMETNRRLLPSLHLTPEVIRKRILKTTRLNRRKVKQFLPGGKFVKEYPSITVAAKKTGSSISSISACALGKRPLTKGFVWRYKGDQYHGEFLQEYLKKIPKQVIQYSIDGEKIQTFETISEAALKTNSPDNGISQALLNNQKTSNGFIWRYEGELFNRKK